MTAETRTVYVVDRGTGPGYEGLRIVPVTVDWVCPQCGGPRGETYSHRFCEDGDWYTCTRWENPCGLVDRYRDVLTEARTRTAAAVWQ